MSQVPRRFERKELQLQAKLIVSGASHAVRIVNISSGGARLGLDSDMQFTEGGDVLLDLDRLGSLQASTVWQRGYQLGIRFAGDPEAMAEVIMGLAMYAGRSDK
ncbi:MAG: hypothetical protein GWP66_05925 [Gammaproteobacteria bacterium]|nr:hypothetical protein [Gammaproteobacteria bacterium]